MAQDGEAVMRSILIVVLTALMLTPAAAQDYEKSVKTCFSTEIPILLVVTCTTVIAAGRGSVADVSMAYAKRGFGHAEMGEADRALADYDLAIGLDRKNATAFNNRGHVLMEKGDYVHALADFDRVVALWPNDYRSYRSRCELKAMIEWLDEALADCNVALKLKPDDLSVLEKRAVVYVKMKAYAVAIAEYDVMLESYPDEELLLFGRGVARRLSGDTAGGDADIAKALTSDPSVADIMAKRDIRP